MTHQITATENRATGTFTYACGELQATHAIDGLTRLCRLMVAAGMSGRAELRSSAGRLRLTLRAIEKHAELTLVETKGGYWRYTPYRPFDYAAMTPRPPRGRRVETPALPL